MQVHAPEYVKEGDRGKSRIYVSIAGDGSFSTVVLAQLRANPAEKFAVKIVNKHLVLRNKMFEYVRNERNIMDALDHEAIVKLRFTFQDQSSLCECYLFMSSCN
jgi:3-phosphoinositide dependent protein kinase-1